MIKSPGQLMLHVPYECVNLEAAYKKWLEEELSVGNFWQFFNKN
jgi:hypothetical protein